MKRLVCWGGGDRASLDSFRWVWQAYHETAQKLGIPTVWAADTPDWHPHVFPGDTVLGVDIWSQHIPCVPGARYVLHNFSGEHPLYQQLGDSKDFLRLQVWTTDAFGEQWDECRRFDRQGQVLFQPWGSDLLREEFMEPVFNPASREVVFVGAVWSDIRDGVELGNEGVIAELREACDHNGLEFVHRTQVSPEELIRLTRSARLAPTVVGQWQCDHAYLPCRAFKNSAYGTLMFSNSAPVTELFDGEHHGWDVGEMLEEALGLKKWAYGEAVRCQQQVAGVYTYRESIAAIDRAFEEIQ